MDPIAFFIARDVQRRALEGAQPPRRRDRTSAPESDRHAPASEVGAHRAVRGPGDRPVVGGARRIGGAARVDALQ
jgi:hypothetical protein